MFSSDAPSALPLFYRSYSRRKADGSRESWSELVDRSVTGLERVGELDQEQIALIRDQMLKRQAMPSGRWLWVGGTRWSDNPNNFFGTYNCFQGDTLILTKEFGCQKISTLKDRQVSVLNGNGEWSVVSFKSHGVQALLELSLKRTSNKGGGGFLEKVLVTPSHRWVLEDGSSRLTTELKSGDRLPLVVAPRPGDQSTEYRLGLRHGLVYGDGSIRGTSTKKERTNFKIRLCNEKAELLPLFEGCRTIYCPSYNGDPLVFVQAADFRDFVEDGNLKKLPHTSSLEYLLGFMRGLLASDGGVSLRNGSPVVLIAGSKELCRWVEMISPSLGFLTNKTRCMHAAGSENNFGIRKSDLYSVTFSLVSLSGEDLLRTSHKQKFSLRCDSEFFWKVLDIEETGELEEVYCCEEPVTQSFVLAGGLLTGNCSSTHIDSPEAFGHLMNLAMQGCGTGAVLEQHVVKKLPPIRNRLEVVVIGEPGQAPLERRQEGTISLPLDSDRFLIVVGDSRQGWVDAYSELIRYSMAGEEGRQLEINVDVRGVRPAGERLKGFGGVANPVKLPGLFLRVASILNEAQGRKLTPLECCLLIDEAALVVVAGNVRRSAGMRQFSADDEEAAIAKANLWRQDENGDWHIDAERDALRMANHTRVFHRRPSYEEVLEAVTKQYHSGEGAIQFAPEAIARGNADVLLHFSKRYFIDQYCKSVEQGRRFLAEALISKDRIFDEKELDHRMGRYGLNPCLTGETLVWVKFKENGEQFEGFYTAKGLAEDSGSLQELTVMDAKGDWVPTRFECTDPAAEVWEITGENVSVVRGEKHRQSFSVRTTGNHAFFLDESLTPIAVEDLKVGDRLMAARHHFFDPTCESSYCEVTSVQKTDKIEPVYCCQVPTTHSFDLMHLHSHNCGEIGMKDNLCNLAEVHLNLIDPNDTEEQIKAFQAAALAVAALLNHEFTIDRYQYSREIDPIVGVSFTGLFDFFVKAFGVEWLQWWEAGRPEGWGLETLVLTSPLTRNGRMRQTHFADSAEYFRLYEEAYLRWWKEIVERAIAEYCQQHEIRRPNRCTTVQPAGSKSLLTNASPGWHPPKAQRFIRRMTFGKNDPIALACLDYGYTVVPSQSDKDENGRLLDDPFDPRCTEWLVEIPTEVSWANLPGADRIDISKFSAIAQFDFYMQVQRYYTTHNTSATIEYRENEIEALADCIYDAIRSDKGYVSAALLARFDASETFPRLPFEPITRAKYQELSEAVNNRRCRSFQSALQLHSTGVTEDASNQGPAQCDSDRCLIG